MLGRPLAGETVFILGSGPSLTRVVVDQVRDRKTIAVNSSARLAPWATYLFFADNSWFRDHRPIVDTFPGIVITASERAERRSTVRKVILVKPPVIQSKRLSSAHHAVDVALALGAAVIVLLGCDCRAASDGRTHCHDDHKHNPVVYAEFVEMWGEYPGRAARHGARIINSTPGSAIAHFPQISLDRVLGGDDSFVLPNEFGLPECNPRGHEFDVNRVPPTATDPLQGTGRLPPQTPSGGAEQSCP